MERDRIRSDRRRFIGGLAIGSLAASAAPLLAGTSPQSKEEITSEVLEAAATIAGLAFTPEERELMLEDVRRNLDRYQELRSISISNAVPPALHFIPLGNSAGAEAVESASGSGDLPETDVNRPASMSELAFMPAHKLAGLLRNGDVTSVELTRLYLDRLRTYDPRLECVIAYTEERAMKQARKADAELQKGAWRGPLHGIPWGAKDLLAVAGYKTTWGAMPFKDQTIDEDALAVQKLDEAGAVLIAKLTLGALAWGDVWYGGTTKNPWNLEQGSSGSSAGSASATAAGLSGFTIGSETWGSIVSPCTRCGSTGLRPTFGAVGRSGAMALSWSMDKLGPIARSAEDCAYIYDAIRGVDPGDPVTGPMPFTWQRGHSPGDITIGVPMNLFEEDRDDAAWKTADQQTLQVLREMGYKLKPISLPDFPASALAFILNAEAATAFDELTRENADDQLVRQIRNAWPNAFRTARMVPAVEYLRANRARTLLMRAMEESIAEVDLYVCPSFGGNNLLTTNLTGHPCVVMPNGFRSDGTPTSITFNGHLRGESVLLSVAAAWQRETGFHEKHPQAFMGN